MKTYNVVLLRNSWVSGMQLVHMLKGIWKPLAPPTQFSASHLATQHTFLIPKNREHTLPQLDILTLIFMALKKKKGFCDDCEKYLLGPLYKPKCLIYQSDVGNTCLSSAVRTEMRRGA